MAKVGLNALIDQVGLAGIEKDAPHSGRTRAYPSPKAAWLRFYAVKDICIFVYRSPRTQSGHAYQSPKRKRREKRPSGRAHPSPKRNRREKRPQGRAYQRPKRTRREKHPPGHACQSVQPSNTTTQNASVHMAHSYECFPSRLRSRLGPTQSVYVRGGGPSESQSQAQGKASPRTRLSESQHRRHKIRPTGRAIPPRTDQNSTVT